MVVPFAIGFTITTEGLLGPWTMHGKLPAAPGPTLLIIASGGIQSVEGKNKIFGIQ